MKGIFNIIGTQAQIELEGESWTQDQTITGLLKLSSNDQLEAPYGAAFCIIDLRKLKKKDPKAFQIIKKIYFKLGVQDYPLELNHEDSGSSHCLSDGVFTLALLTGNLENPLECSQLQLNVQQRVIVHEILKIFETFKRCSIKSIKNKKNNIEVKITTPSSGNMAQIDTLALLLGFKSGQITITYQFQIKKLTVGDTGVETVKEKSKFIQTWEKKDYLSFGALDQDKVLSLIDQALISWK